MENMLDIDTETKVPLSALDDAPWNPKVPINSEYKRGLNGSLDVFGNRDRLKIWPNPSKKGRYYILNGNQRKHMFIDRLLISSIKTEFFLDDNCSVKKVEEIRDDSANKKKIKVLEKAVLGTMIPVQIMTELSPGVPLTKENAILFTSIFDRNAAKFDEVKQTENYRTILKSRMLGDEDDPARKAMESRIKSMVRPEIPKNPPQSEPAEGQQSFEFAAPGTFKPTEQEPWGPPPPADYHVAPEQQPRAEQFISMVFAVSKEGYNEINESVLRSKSRVFREEKLKNALKILESLTIDKLDGKIDSIVVELALLLTNRHISNEQESGNGQKAT
jgi:hypothetical protein